ncbi:retrovirus-related pol polyprotein from transposon TNT 1-94 [Tanacetum coccineum]
MSGTVPPIPPPLGTSSGNSSSPNVNRVDTMPTTTDLINTTTTTNVSQSVVNENLPQLLDSRGGSHVINVPVFDKEDFTSWNVRFLVFLDGLEPYILKTLEDGPFARAQRFTIQASSSKALISNNHFQDIDSDVEEDQRTSNKFMADLNAEYHERALLANQKGFYKRSRRVGSARKLIDKSKETCFTCRKTDHFQKDYPSNKTSTPSYPSSNNSFNKPKPYMPPFNQTSSRNTESVSSKDKGTTKIRAFMAIAEDEPSIGKADARYGQWVNITMKKITSDTVVSESETQEPLPPLPKLIGATLELYLNSLISLFDANSRTLPEEVFMGTIFNQNDEVILISLRRRDVYVIDMLSFNKESNACFFAKASPSANWYWHKRLSYLNFKNINNLAKHNLVSVLPSLTFSKDKNCSACEKGKHHRASFKIKRSFSINKSLHLLHMDLFRPFKPQTINHNKYTLVIIDEYSRNMENLNEVRVNELRSDNGTEFRNHKLEEFYDEKGISQNFSSPCTLKQNGAAERRNRTLIEAARTMLNSAKLQKQFWREAVNTACYTQNRSIIVKRHGKTAYDVFRGRSPDISYFNVFGSLMYFHNHRRQLRESFLMNKLMMDSSLVTLSSQKRIQVKLIEALEEEGWIIAMQEELNQFERNKYPKGSGFNLKAYSDSDYAGCNLDRKSTSEGCQILGGKLVCWSAKKQSSVAMSSVGAEYVVVAGCCAQVLWIKSQLADYDVLYDKVPIFCDNTSVIAISNNPVLHSRTKHIDIRYHFIRDHILKGDIELHFVPTDLHLADIFTKPLAEPSFTRLVADLEYLKEFWYTAEVDEATKTITFSLSFVEKPLFFTQDEFISAIGIPVCRNVVPLPPKDTMRAGLATLGLFDKDKQTLSSTVLGSHDQLNLNQQTIAYSLIWGLKIDIGAIIFSDFVHKLQNGKKNREPKQSLIPSSGEVNVDDSADKSLSRTSVQPVTQPKFQTKSLDASESVEEQLNQPKAAEAEKSFQAATLSGSLFIHQGSQSTSNGLPVIDITPKYDKEVNGSNETDSYLRSMPEDELASLTGFETPYSTDNDY